jgi:hypothetical protein
MIGVNARHEQEVSMSQPKDGCVKPAGGPVLPANDTPPNTMPDSKKEVPRMLARVGQTAPDFEATAFIPETGKFQTVKLSDFKGKWITLCFYPGDFTFV